MYRHLLLPTDGSELSQRAALYGIQFAKAMGARVTAVHVMPTELQTLDQWAHGGKSKSLQLVFARKAMDYLEEIERAARHAGLPCDCVCVSASEPYRKILGVAEEKKCDAIFMASHGVGGRSSAATGSETAKVLTHSHLPVIVHCDGKREAVVAGAETPALLQ